MRLPTYAYAANNPLKYADPSGLGPIDHTIANFMFLTGLLWPGAQVSFRWSNNVYGPPQLIPVVENHPLQPAAYTTTYTNVVCSPGTLGPTTWHHEEQHLKQAQVLSPADLYIVSHLASQAWSWLTTGTYPPSRNLKIENEFIAVTKRWLV